MIVTPRDFPIALYTIPPLARITESSGNFHAVIYCNGLAGEHLSQISYLIKGYERVSIRNNNQHLRAIRNNLKIGDFTQENGSMEQRQGLLETAPEVWSRELVQLDADLVTMIDPDFEILDPEYMGVMLDGFAYDPRIAFYSTDYSPDRNYFESYSKEYAIVAERWHTWFCVYRRTALEKYHDFSYIEDRSGALPVKRDHSGMLQKIFIDRYGYVGSCLTDAYSTQFLHYSSFAQNRSLRGWRLALYRIVRIGRHNGWVHKHHSPYVARIVRKLSGAAWRALRLGQFDDERKTYAHEADSQVISA